MKNFFKSIWNLFFPEKKSKGNYDRTLTIDVEKSLAIPNPTLEDYFNPKDFEAIERQKESAMSKWSFRKQQLVGKILTFGKSQIRIHKLISISEIAGKLKYKYYISPL